jgi:hypothetical protein
VTFKRWMLLSIVLSLVTGLVSAVCYRAGEIAFGGYFVMVAMVALIASFLLAVFVEGSMSYVDSDELAKLRSEVNRLQTEALHRRDKEIKRCDLP